VRYRTFHAQAVEQQTQAEAWKLPMRVGAGLLLVDLLVTVLVGLLTLAGGADGFLIWALVHAAVDAYLAVNLLRLRDTARRTTIWWAVLGLILGTFAAISSRSWLDLAMQVSFSGALLILLPGKPSNLRVILAVGLFVIGYLGSICGVFTVSFLKGLNY
jgi:hypothetical protein